MDAKSLVISIDKFPGLVTALASPPAGSALVCKNVALNKIRNALQNPSGYGLKYTLPQVTDAEAPFYLNPAIYKISNLVWENIRNFHTPVHGGQDLTFAVGTCRITGRYSGSPTYDRPAIFVRPYWNGSTWIDEWKNLLEMFVFTHYRQTDLEKESEWINFVTFANDSAVGTIDWTNMANVEVDDTNYASVTLLEAEVSHYLKATGIQWGTSPLHPEGCTLLGIKVKVIKYANSTGVYDHSVKIVVDGAVYGDEHADTETEWTTSPAEEKMYGSDVDDWGGVTMDKTDEGDFGVAIAVDHTGAGTKTAYIDCILLKRYYTLPDSDKIYVDDGIAYDFETLDPTEEVFNDDHFVGMIAYFKDSGDNDRSHVISECDYDTDNFYYPDDAYYLKTIGLPEEGLPPDNGKIYVYQFWLPEYADEGQLPTTILSDIHAVLNGIRISSGGDSDDVAMKSHVVDKTWGWGVPQNETDEIILESIKMSMPCVLGLSTDTGTDFEAGTYYAKVTYSDDDGNESTVMDDATVTFGPSALNINASITLNRGTIPKSARYINLYFSDDDSLYYLTKEIDLAGVDDWTEDNETGEVSIGFNISADDWNNAGPELAVNIGRAENDSGHIRYANSNVIGFESYAVKTYGAQNYKNTIFVSAEHGSGAMQYDIFPSDGLHMIDLEYSDGDELVYVVNLDDKIVAWKKNTVIVLYKNNSGGYDRKIVSRGNGVCSVRSIGVFEDYVYVADYGAVMRYSMRGSEIINPQWLQDWKDLADNYKEAAVGALDDYERQYRLAVNGIEYILDLDTGNWTVQDLPDQPIAYSKQENGEIDFLTQAGIFTISKDEHFHDDGDISVEYESNEIYPADIIGPDGHFYDFQVDSVALSYESDVDITVKVYAAGSATESDTYVFSSAKRNDIFHVSDDCRGKSFRFKITATLDESGNLYAMVIRKLGIKVTLNPISGDILSES